MRLQRLHIDGFGGLRERIIDFGPGVTVLLGANETGKSTALRCIAQVLMGKPSQRSLFPEMTPWDGGTFSAALEFEQEAMQYRLTRRFDESGTRAVALHRLHDDGTETLVTQEMTEVRKVVAAALGTADDRIFYRVFCLAQADLSPLDNFGGLREQLERTASGAEVAVTAAVKRIDERLAILRRGVGQPALVQNWGLLKQAEEARRDWESRLHEAGRQQRRLADAREKAEHFQQQLTDGRARVEEIAGMLEDDRRRSDLLARLAEYKSSWANSEGERERIERLHADRIRLQGLLDGLPAICTDPAMLRARLSAVERHHGMPARMGWLSLAIGILVLAAAWALGKPLYGMIAALAGALLGIPVIVRAGRHTREEAGLCHELGVTRLADAAQRLEAAERYRRELDATTLALQTVTDADALTERRRALALEIATTEESIAQIPGKPLSAEEAHRLPREQRSLQDAIPGWQEQERALARETAILEETERDLIDLEDGVTYWRQEEARAREEEQTLLLARELLIAAGEQAHGALSEPLSAAIAPLFSVMTGGRYPRVRVEGNANTLAVYPLDSAGTPVEPEQLSRGTLDQFVLAVRLGLGQVIAGDGLPIFLLDDPLLHFDADRRREALSMLADLGETTQIVLATHDERVLDDLPGAAVVRVEVPSPESRVAS